MERTGDTLTPLEAADAIRRIERQDVLVRRRTGGAMWMMWGVTSAAIFVTYALAFALRPEGAGWFGALWIPWALAGLLLTRMLWRSAQAVLGGPPPRRELAWHAGLFLLLVVGGTAVVGVTRAPFPQFLAALGGLGLVSVALGSFGILTLDAADRTTKVLTGAGMAVAAVALALWAGPASIMAIACAVVAFVAFSTSGLVLASRG